MAINQKTPASATLDPASKFRELFSSKSTSNNSGTINVTTQPYYIQAYDLGVSDTVTVQIAGGSGSGTIFEDYAPLGVPVTLTQDQNHIRLDWPAQYRLVFSGVAVTAVYVIGYEGTMTEESIYGVAATNQV